MIFKKNYNIKIVTSSSNLLKKSLNDDSKIIYISKIMTENGYNFTSNSFRIGSEYVWRGKSSKYIVKENDFLNQSLYVEILKDAVDAGCKQIILGCTELSLMEASFGQHDYPVIDAQSVLVDRTIERALALRKE